MSESVKYSRHEIPCLAASVVAGTFPVLLGYMGLPGSYLLPLHITGFSVMLGTQLWVTFIAGFVLMSCLQHEELENSLSVTFSAYFNLVTLLASVCLGSRIGGHLDTSINILLEWFTIIIVCTVLCNLVWQQSCIQDIADRGTSLSAPGSSGPRSKTPWNKKGYAVCRSLVNFVAVTASIIHWLSLFNTKSWGDALHFLLFSLMFGTQIWTTFVAGIVMIRSLSRHTFGRAQRGLFPAFFILLSISSAILLYIYLLRQPFSSWAFSDIIQVLSLAVVFGTSTASVMYVVPLNVRIMEEMHKLEREEGHGYEVGMGVPEPLKQNPRHREIHKRFGKAHGMSMMISMAGLLGSFVHLFYIFALAQ